MSSAHRCAWVTCDPLYISYHDHEWGIPIVENRLLFECLTLECMQAGLNWLTILKKRENYRICFDNFEAEKIVHYDDNKCAKLMTNAGIIRNPAKIRAVVTNAKVYLKIKEEYGDFSSYIWRFVDGNSIQNHWKHIDQIPKCTAVSDAMARDLKQRGFKFIGTTICYAFMQATGMVNDHMVNCFYYKRES